MGSAKIICNAGNKKRGKTRKTEKLVRREADEQVSKEKPGKAESREAEKLEKQSRREKQKSGEAGKQRGTTVEKQRSEEAKKQTSGEANKQRTMKAKAPGKTQQIVVAITDARGTLNPLGKMPQKTCATAPPGKKLYMHVSLAPTLFFATPVIRWSPK